MNLRDIKTKQKIQAIKTKDTKGNIQHLFVGTFSVLAQDGGSNSEIVSLSEEVIAYEDTIRKYAIEYDIEDYVSLLQAIMMQESGGKGNDPMQPTQIHFLYLR